MTPTISLQPTQIGGLPVPPPTLSPAVPTEPAPPSGGEVGPPSTGPPTKIDMVQPAPGGKPTDRPTWNRLPIFAGKSGKSSKTAWSGPIWQPPPKTWSKWPGAWCHNLLMHDSLMSSHCFHLLRQSPSMRHIPRAIRVPRPSTTVRARRASQIRAARTDITSRHPMSRATNCRGPNHRT